MRATVAELKKRNRKVVNKIKHRAPLHPGEITFLCTTLRPLLIRTDEVSNWISFQEAVKFL